MYTSGTDVENSILSQNSGTLSVAGSLSTSGQLTVGGSVISSGGFRVLGSATDDVNSATWYGVGASSLNLWTGNQNAVQVAGFFGLDFETANGLLVIRGDNGNVGIGTSTPAQNLTVAGTLGVQLATNNPTQNVATLVPLGYAGATGAENWALRGVYQYSTGVNITNPVATSI